MIMCMCLAPVHNKDINRMSFPLHFEPRILHLVGSFMLSIRSTQHWVHTVTDRSYMHVHTPYRHHLRLGYLPVRHNLIIEHVLLRQSTKLSLGICLYIKVG